MDAHHEERVAAPQENRALPPSHPRNASRFCLHLHRACDARPGRPNGGVGVVRRLSRQDRQGAREGSALVELVSS
eukprot:724367-Prymnesium_polylepis.1